MTNDFLQNFNDRKNSRYIRYWYARYNLGDVYSDYLFDQMYDKSLLDQIPNRKTMMFIGSELPLWANRTSLCCGLGNQYPAKRLNPAMVRPENFCYTRGKISRAWVQASRIPIPKDLPVGDNGLLASLLFSPASREKCDVGIISHIYARNKVQERLEKAKKMLPGMSIFSISMGDVSISPLQLFDFISSCRIVLASSLHAIIFAHSFGVPALFFSDVDGYKFKDYYSVYDRIDYRDLNRKIGFEEALGRISDKEFISSVNPTAEEVAQVQKNIIRAMPYRWCFTAKGKELLEWAGGGIDEERRRNAEEMAVKSIQEEWNGGPVCLLMQNKDENVLQNSSSGGVVPALVDLVRKQGGTAFGVVFSDDFASLKYVEIDDTNMKDAMGSKYIDVRMSEENKQRMSELLEQGKKVLFVGRPCQCHWLRGKYGQYPNLILVELFCFGVPQDSLWTEYAASLVQKHGRIKSVDFRDKTSGWRNYNFTVEFENGEVLSEPHGQNQYMRQYLSRRNLQPKCGICGIKSSPPFADISCGDAWGMDILDDKGTSIVVAFSEEGKNLLNSLKDKFTAKEASLDDIRRIKCHNGGFFIRSGRMLSVH